MDYTNSLKIFNLILFILIVGTSGVLALGISTPYWDSNPLEMYPGQTKDIAFPLVNKLGNPTAKAFVTLDESAGIASISSGSEYNVPAGARDKKVVLRISIPESAKIGDTYEVKFSVKSVSDEDQGGNVQLGVGYGVSFPVKIVFESEVPKPIGQIELPQVEEKGVGGVILIIIVIIIVIIIIWWLAKRKKMQD